MWKKTTVNESSKHDKMEHHLKTTSVSPRLSQKVNCTFLVNNIIKYFNTGHAHSQWWETFVNYNISIKHSGAEKLYTVSPRAFSWNASHILASFLRRDMPNYQRVTFVNLARLTTIFLQCDYWNRGTWKIIQSQRFLNIKDSVRFTFSRAYFDQPDWFRVPASIGLSQ